MAQDRQTVISRDDKKRIITKAIKPFKNLDYRGVDMAKKWPQQRILNEAAALQFIRDSTTIPVPAVIAVGEGPDGFFVTTELIDGIPLADIGERCEVPTLPGHEKTKCSACQATAIANAKTFVEETVLPQLRKLTSHTTGLDGFVNPPPWVTEVDRRESWDTKTSAVPEFVFCHGDLGPYNIMVDPFTLMVTGLIDFENSGYFPSEFLEQWAIDVKGYYKMYKTMYESPAELSRLTMALQS
ncbi:kinase-like domain-containing protein [Durotheca rogersii]|uniref:kinase-like domain-containing protein n=1 Tax=Durotheca rogersii TaxID=419775 RepID=UPI00221F987C|nr:kinase-like domain-containing protein [Durotheca rogersii]KAI5867562.1 kinase-like domain-containing protein [Durotheca rogersii]